MARSTSERSETIGERLARTTGVYTDACFSIDAVGGDERLNLVDGGFTDWGERLLSDRRARMLTSGIGLDRLTWLAVRGS